MLNSAKKIVFVGLSGGVDSAVAAALLKQQGYNVVGVFMRFWAEEGHRENGCCSADAEAAARLVAAKLDIPFYVFDVAKEFKKKVVDYFLAELAAGRTPNPCVVCNPEIKFGLFLARAGKMGADFIATGHYARVAVIASGRREGGNPADSGDTSGLLRRSAFRNDTVKLLAAKDKQKDQSYFLVGLKQNQLSKAVFPLGNYLKKEVYDLALKWRLPYRQGESFDICFVDDYQQFLRKYLKLKSGKIVNISNVCHPELVLGSRKRSRNKFGMTKNIVLGQHQGLPLYTIGQRASLGGPGPFYVVKKDIKKNILYVSNNERDLYQKKMVVEKVNWVVRRVPRLPFRCRIKIRYGAEAANAVIARSGATKQSRSIAAVRGIVTSFAAFTPRDDIVKVIFAKSQRAITPGQSAVFYGRGGEMLGGGIIL